MGLTIAVAFDPEKYEGKLFMPRRKLVPFPAARCGAPGHLVTYFRALPPSTKPPADVDNLYWWVDCQFLPYSDNELCCSVGAYLSRPGRTPATVSPFMKGLVYTVKFTDKLSCSVIKGTSSTAMPKVTPHPEGSKVCYIGTGCVTLMDLATLHSVVKNKDMRNSNFRFTAISPNGIYIAALARVSRDFELGILVIDSTFLLTIARYECHLICPGFRGTRQYTEDVECKFSPDSRAVAVSSSMGLLFVVNRGRQEKHTVIIGQDGVGILDINDTRLSTPRSFDFDPRYLHRILAFAGTNDIIYFCDLLTGTLEEQLSVGPEAVDCLQYCARGPVLAVATTDAKVRIIDPDTCQHLYALDGTVQGPDASMTHVNGVYPTILRMSFSKCGEHMAMSATDGMVRVWQLVPDLSLQHICRITILKHVRCSDVQKLPLPPKVILYILEWPTLT